LKCESSVILGHGNSESPSFTLSFRTVLEVTEIECIFKKVLVSRTNI